MLVECGLVADGCGWVILFDLKFVEVRLDTSGWLGLQVPMLGTTVGFENVVV